MKNQIVEQDPSLPDYQHLFYREILPTLIELQDLWDGKENWFKNGMMVDSEKCNRYLPREKHDLDFQYIHRLERSRYENRFRDAIEKDFAGLLTQFQLKDASEALEKYQDNIDLKGNSLTAFLKAADALALRDGLCYIYADYQRADPNIRGEDERQARGRRPFLILYPRHQIHNWEVHYEYGEEQIDLVIIKEYAYVKVGKYGQELEERYRILTPGAYEVQKIIESDGQKVAVPALDSNGNAIAGTTNLTKVPLIPYSLTSTESFEVNTFPTKDIADLCLELYRLHSDKLENLHLCNIPVPTFHEKNLEYSTKGEKNSTKEAVINYSTAYWNVDLKWAEPDGKAILHSQQECKTAHAAIDSKTLAFLSGSQIARTATEANLDASQSRSNFAGLSAQKESAVERVFKFFDAYESDINNTKTSSRIEVDKKLIDIVSNLSPKDLIEFQTTGAFSKEFVLRRLSEIKAFGRYLTDEEIAEELNKSGENGFNLNNLDDNTVLAGGISNQ